jgi:hypothetical protein
MVTGQQRARHGVTALMKIVRKQPDLGCGGGVAVDEQNAVGAAGPRECRALEMGVVNPG